MNLYVVYIDPLDYPLKWVLRRWQVGVKGIEMESPPMIVCDTLEGCRDALPAGACCIGRQAGDDPAIAEVWI